VFDKQLDLESEIEKSLQISPSKIMQVGVGFWVSKILFTAINMGLFTHLSQGEQSGQNIKEKLGLAEKNRKRLKVERLFEA